MERPDIPEMGRFYRRRAPLLLQEEAVLYGPEVEWNEQKQYEEYLRRKEPDGITVITNDYSNIPNRDLYEN